MKITFLGTGAADWVLAQHRDIDGFRRNSSIHIDECLLVDPGPDVPDALATFGKDPMAIRYVLNTHKHADHFSESTLESMRYAQLVSVGVGETVTVGKYTVTAYRANHSTANSAVHFIVSDGEKKLFYGMDGAWLLYDEVAAIKQGVDIAVIDATIGDKPGDRRIFEHNNLNMVREIKLSLGKYIGRFLISHMSKGAHTTHAELEAMMSEFGIEVAHDGLEIEI